MPLDNFVNTDIIMGYKSPDFSGLDPARIASNVLSIRNARLQQQTNELALAKAKQEAADQQILQNAYGSQDPTNYLLGLGRTDLAQTVKSQISKEEGEKLDRQTKQIALQDAIAKSDKTKVDNALSSVRDMYAGVVAQYPNLNTQEAADAVLNISQTAHNDPNLGPVLSSTGASHESTKKLVATALANGTLDRFIQNSALSAEELRKGFTPMTRAEQETAAYHKGTLAGQEEARAETRRSNIESESLRSREIALRESENKRNQATFDLEQSTAGQLGITPKAFKERENNYPAATAANESANNAIDAQIADLVALRDHPSLPAITGPYDSRTKGVQFLEGTKDAQSLFNKVVSGQTLQSLIDLRRSSPTGAGLSSISDKDMATLREGTGLDQSQYSDSLKKRINEAISKLENAKTTINNQYSTTYSYKSGGTTPTPPAGGGAKTPPAVNPAVEDLVKKYATPTNKGKQ